MAEKLTYKIRLIGSDGKPYEITYEGLKQALGVCALDKREDHRFNVLWERMKLLEEELEEIYLPQMRERILEFVRKNPDVPTREFTFQIWRKVCNSRARRGAYYKAFTELEESGAIVSTSHGSGQNRTWRLKE